MQCLPNVSGMLQLKRFEQLLTSEVHDSAWRFCCLLAARREDAEDLLQEALIHALERLPQLRDPAGFRGWLLSIVRSRFLNLTRSRRAEQRRVESLYRFAGSADDDPRAAELAAALSALPQQQRLELTLFYLEGLSLKECALALGLSCAALQARLHRARAALRRGLEGHAVSPAESGQAVEECHV